MSRSRKKAIYKDKADKAWYWRVIRRVQNQVISQYKNYDSIEEIEEVPHEKTIINDWDYCDYVSDFEYDSKPMFLSEEEFNEIKEEYRRK